MSEALLSIEDLHVEFATSAGVVRAVEGVTLDVRAGETVAIVGESGCGKSVTAMSVLGLVPSPPSRVPKGSIRFARAGAAGATELVGASDDTLRAIRGNEIAMIFQEPMTSLNPVFRVGDQIAEAIVQHRGLDARAAFEEAVAMLARVGIPSPQQRALDYPHQLSGGMCQRVMIAMALACDPKLLIADEPTTALDVTVQAQILDLLRELQQRFGTAILLITHDLGVVAETAQRVVVMYAGRIVERAGVHELFARPRHPYTAALLNSVPRIGEEGRPLAPVEGSVPDALSLPSGCRFHPRCAFARERCLREEPREERRNALDAAIVHASACFAVDEEPDLDLHLHEPSGTRRGAT